MFEYKGTSRHNLECFSRRCTIFRLAKPAFFRYQQDHRSGFLLKYFNVRYVARFGTYQSVLLKRPKTVKKRKRYVNDFQEVKSFFFNVPSCLVIAGFQKRISLSVRSWRRRSKIQLRSPWYLKCSSMVSFSHLHYSVGSISAALSCLVYPPREEGRSAGSFPEQQLVIEPNYSVTQHVFDAVSGNIL